MPVPQLQERQATREAPGAGLASWWREPSVGTPSSSGGLTTPFLGPWSSSAMFGMIKNSLLGTAELWPCRLLLSRGEKEEVPYEERVYEGGKFATVELTGKPYDEAVKESVLKLLKYVGGSNDQGVGMGMMAPVCTTVFPAEDGSLKHKVKVLLRIPSQFQASPPSPTDESIQIEDREEMTVYSTQFGGYAKETDFVNYAAKLTSALGNEETYHKDFYFCNGYDPPMKPYGRRNEVWLLKK